MIGARIAAHAADIVKGVRGAAEWDRRMSLARRNLDWEEQISLSMDPPRARRLHDRFAGSGTTCSMCGPVLRHGPGGEVPRHIVGKVPPLGPLAASTGESRAA